MKPWNILPSYFEILLSYSLPKYTMVAVATFYFIFYAF